MGGMPMNTGPGMSTEEENLRSLEEPGVHRVYVRKTSLGDVNNTHEVAGLLVAGYKILMS